jgi:long-chain fatty acid transport protein
MAVEKPTANREVTTMQDFMRRPCALLAGIACSLPLSVGAANAAGYQLREVSAVGTGNALAGSTAGAADLSTVFLNPAGMTRLTGHGVQADVNVVLPRIEFSGDAANGGVPYSGGEGGDAGEDVVVPALYGMWDIGPTLKAGLSLTIPFGLATKYDEDWVGRYFAVESEIENYVLSPSIAWKPSDRLSLGAGLQIGRTDAKLTRAINLSPLGLSDGMSDLEGSDYGYGYTLGMLYEFTPASRIGLTYRSRIDYTLDGDADIQGVPDAVAALIPTLQDTDAEAEVTTPDVLSFGAYHEINPKWAVMSEVSWTNWSVFDELRVEFEDGRPDDVTDEDWDDSLFFSVGADYRLSETRTIRFGVAYDESPVPDDTRTARIPDADRYWVSLGYAQDFGTRGTFNVGYTHLFFEDASISETTDAGTLDGEYSGSADIVAANIVFRF